MNDPLTVSQLRRACAYMAILRGALEAEVWSVSFLRTKGMSGHALWGPVSPNASLRNTEHSLHRELALPVAPIYAPSVKKPPCHSEEEKGKGVPAKRVRKSFRDNLMILRRDVWLAIFSFFPQSQRV